MASESVQGSLRSRPLATGPGSAGEHRLRRLLLGRAQVGRDGGSSPSPTSADRHKCRCGRFRKRATLGQIWTAIRAYLKQNGVFHEDTSSKVAVLAGLALTVASVGLAPFAMDPRETLRPSGPPTPLRSAANRTDSDRLAHHVGDGGRPRWRVVTHTRTPNLHNTQTLYAEAGVERFSGCIDRNGNGKCGKRDYRGEMYAVYPYLASFDLEGNLIKVNAYTRSPAVLAPSLGPAA